MDQDWEGLLTRTLSTADRNYDVTASEGMAIGDVDEDNSFEDDDFTSSHVNSSESANGDSEHSYRVSRLVSSSPTIYSSQRQCTPSNYPIIPPPLTVPSSVGTTTTTVTMISPGYTQYSPSDKPKYITSSENGIGGGGGGGGGGGSKEGSVGRGCEGSAGSSNDDRFGLGNGLNMGGVTTTVGSIPTIGSSNHSAYKCGKQTKIFPGRIRKRVVLKNGSVNLCKEHVEKRSQRYLQDTFTTMVDIQWRWNLLVFSMGFLLSWLGFAIVWYFIAYAHGDLEPFDNSNQPNDSSIVEDFSNIVTNSKPCVQGIDSFTSAFLFSIETQHTIGYGSRLPTTECPEALLIMCVQAITGVMIQCFMVGFVFAKLSRPKKRSQTLMFSRSSVMTLRDGKLCLMFRVGDVRNRSHIIGCTISALVINRKVTLEGEVIPFYHNNLKVRFDNSDSNVFLVWPATIVHEVDLSSPFYNLSADELAREKFEIVVILEGTIESTGQSIQARTSYLPCEILWGHRFETMVAYRRDTGQYRVDYSKFNNTYEIDTPTCSAKTYYEYQRFIKCSTNSIGGMAPSVINGSGGGGGGSSVGLPIGTETVGYHHSNHSHNAYNNSSNQSNSLTTRYPGPITTNSSCLSSSPMIDCVSTGREIIDEECMVMMMKTHSGDSGLGHGSYGLLSYPLPFKGPIRFLSKDNQIAD